MSEEIKEILEDIKEIYYFKPLLDYITNLQNQLEEKTYLYNKLDIESKYVINNLQEENQRLKEIVENLTTMTVCGDRKQIKNTAQYKLEQAQSRIDKAIEYLKYGVEPEEMEDYIYENLIEILKGE